MHRTVRLAHHGLKGIFFSLLLMVGAQAAPARLVSLAPHTTELIFALGQGDKLLAVSDYSDYPEAAKALPKVASHTGADLEAIMRLQPDLILAWPGGNKPQDLARLRSVGFEVFTSSPQTPGDIAQDLRRLGRRLDVSERAEHLAAEFEQNLSVLANQYHREKPLPVFYYLWQQPLMTIGKGAWANHLLAVCGARNVMDTLPVEYPTVTLEQVLSANPTQLVAAINDTRSNQLTFWRARLPQLNVPLKTVNPDLLHRFSPRLISGIRALCQTLHHSDPTAR